MITQGWFFRKPAQLSMIYGVEFVVFIALGGFFFCEFVQLL